MRNITDKQALYASNEDLCNWIDSSRSSEHTLTLSANELSRRNAKCNFTAKSNSDSGSVFSGLSFTPNPAGMQMMIQGAQLYKDSSYIPGPNPPSPPPVNNYYYNVPAPYIPYTPAPLGVYGR